MQARWQNVWENVRSSLWFLPSILVALALLLSSLLIELDVLLARRQSTVLPWLFSGTADAARAILSVVAGSLITVISIAISLTMVALVQASAQFTPRLLRQFTASRVNQVVLGAYTATFVYALLVLRTVRSAEQNDPFVPALSVTVAVALALVCLGLLIFFIHHMSLSLQVAVIIDRVRLELIEQLDALYPPDRESGGPGIARTVEPTPAPADGPFVVRAAQSGFLRRLDTRVLRDIPLDGVSELCIRPQIGAYVAYGSVLACLDQAPTAELAAGIRSACVLDRERSIQQDPLFAIRQLVDIALKALSPGINDPTTAEYVLYHLGDAIGRLAERPFPATSACLEQPPLRLSRAAPAWSDFVDAAFAQIRRAARDDVQVTATLLAVLGELAQRPLAHARGLVLEQQVARIRAGLDQASLSPLDLAALQAQADAIIQALRAQQAIQQPAG